MLRVERRQDFLSLVGWLDDYSLRRVWLCVQWHDTSQGCFVPYNVIYCAVAVRSSVFHHILACVVPLLLLAAKIQNMVNTYFLDLNGTQKKDEQNFFGGVFRKYFFARDIMVLTHTT